MGTTRFLACASGSCRNWFAGKPKLQTADAPSVVRAAPTAPENEHPRKSKIFWRRYHRFFVPIYWGEHALRIRKEAESEKGAKTRGLAILGDIQDSFSAVRE
jgi:hypothetical protein